jgi:tetratricopeptide (TPR) repeat protein/class 3 adenylate cyclase
MPEPPSDSGSNRTLEMAHVLFMDIVAYSRLPMDEQHEALHHLQEAVRETQEFERGKASDQLIRLPTGDGMALVFLGDVEAPVRCALELHRILRRWPEMQLRMGIHTGPVYLVDDINDARNVAGGGINIAQRVMDCGDGGHILISKTVADVLDQVSKWKTALHDLGAAEVKHGVRVRLYNLYTDEAGNPELPQKLRTARTLVAATRSQWKMTKVSLGVVMAVVIAVLVVGGFLYHRRSRQMSGLTDKDTIVLADFANRTGDAVFDDTLKAALSVALRQSPFLNLLSDDRVRATLQLMTRSADAPLTSEVTREVCQRAQSKGYISGSIATLGNEYVVGLKAVNCQNGDTLAEEQVTAASKEKVLDALGDAASKLRGELGESLATVRKFDVPLADATTPSLEALKAYSLGLKATREQGTAAALTYHLRAIELDPNFAMAYRAIGNDYGNLNEVSRAREYWTKAFQLREHTSEWEQLAITAYYYLLVTGELNKAIQINQERVQSFPRDAMPYRNLGYSYALVGQYEKAAEITTEGMRLAPNNVGMYQSLTIYLPALQRFDETRQIIHATQAHQLDDADFHSTLYCLAFLDTNSAAMEEQQRWFASHAEFEHFGLALASDTEAYIGHLGKSRELTKRAVDSSIRADSKETGAIWQANAALEEAADGNAAEARQMAAAALKLAPASQGMESEAALAFAMAGDTARAESLAQDLGKRFPLDTQTQSLWLPAIQAQLALDKRDPASALTALQAASSIELGQIGFVNNLSCLYHVYVRGEAYLAAGQGSAAAAEFQKILDHSGIVWNCWTGALAHLGVARGNALQSRTSQGADADAARVRALAAYKDFLALWKNADPDIPILKEAKAEYAKLQ